MIKKEDKNKVRINKHKRIRYTLSGTAERPRLNVYRSLSNIYVQVINDVTGTTLCSSSTVEKDILSKIKGKSKKEQASLVGQDIAKKAAKLKIKEVVFDRGGYIYTGRVKELADGARSAGLKF